MRTSRTMQHDVSGILYPRKSAGDLRGITFKPTDSKSSLSSVRTDASSSMTKTTPLWASPSVMTYTQHRYGRLYSAPQACSNCPGEAAPRRLSLYSRKFSVTTNNHSQLGGLLIAPRASLPPSRRCSPFLGNPGRGGLFSDWSGWICDAFLLPLILRRPRSL